jgi:hypothetical protein
VNRIFLTTSILSNAFLAVTFALGWAVRDPGVRGSSGIELTAHFLCGVASITVAMFVHALVLTYFMGTGRWIEETAAAYRLGPQARKVNVRLKYRALPGMVGCLILLIVVGAFGAASASGAALDFPAAKTLHMVLASIALLSNVLVNAFEYDAIVRNGRLINTVMDQVREIRRERGLPVDSAVSEKSGAA